MRRMMWVHPLNELRLDKGEFYTLCHAIKMKDMVFRYTWVYSKEDTMAHTYRAMVTS